MLSIPKESNEIDVKVRVLNIATYQNKKIEQCHCDELWLLSILVGGKLPTVSHRTRSSLLNEKIAR